MLRVKYKLSARCHAVIDQRTFCPSTGKEKKKQSLHVVRKKNDIYKYIYRGHELIHSNDFIYHHVLLIRSHDWLNHGML